MHLTSPVRHNLRQGKYGRRRFATICGKANTSVAGSPQFVARQIQASPVRRNLRQGKYKRRRFAAICGKVNTSVADSPQFAAR
jgi:hypothetical protein